MTTASTTSQLMNPTEAAQYLGVSVNTLEFWRTTKRVALRYIKVGGLVRYRLRDVEDFLDSRTVTPGEPPKPRRRRRADRKAA